MRFDRVRRAFEVGPGFGSTTGTTDAPVYFCRTRETPAVAGVSRDSGAGLEAPTYWLTALAMGVILGLDPRLATLRIPLRSHGCL
jgi:hypothetical protein